MQVVFIVGGLSIQNDEGRTNIARNLSSILIAKGINSEILQPTFRNILTLYNKLAVHKGATMLVFITGPSSYLSFVFMSYLALIKRIYSSKIFVFMLQPTLFLSISRKMIIPLLKFLRIDLILVQSKRTYILLRSYGISNIKILPSGVSIERFKPLESTEKMQYLREKYNLPKDKTIVLHVGPIKSGRGIEHLIQLCHQNNIAVIVVGRPHDYEEDMIKKLMSNGCIIINRFLSQIDEVYKLSDIYIFPTETIKNVIEMPLSILEAMASNLIIVTTSLDGVLTYWRNNPGVGFYVVEESNKIPVIVNKIIEERRTNTCTRKLVEQFDWNNIVKIFLGYIREVYAK
jgi:glycosyltransferase involved in cell wall biosynthesis